MRVQSGDPNTHGTQADAREKLGAAGGRPEQWEEGPSSDRKARASVKSEGQVCRVIWIQERNAQHLKHISQVYARVSG